MSTPEQIKQVIKAIENSNYTWRTPEGIAQDTGLSPQTVKEILKTTEDEVIQSEMPDATGRELFTTRSHYRSRAPIWRRLLGALKNRVD